MRKLLTLITMVLIAMTASAQHNYVNGFCTDDGCTDIYEPATLVNGYYEIDNGGKLFWFAEQVNNGVGVSYNAKLTADIDLENRLWTPMGNVIWTSTTDGKGSVSTPYAHKGEFDGQGYSISNLMISADESTAYAAFIGSHTGTKDVKDFKISGTATTVGTSENHIIAGVIGNSDGNHKIQDVWCSVNLTAPNSGIINTRLSGIVARALSCTVNRCVYDGTINGYGTKMQVAGIMGWNNSDNITISNCLFAGTLISTNTGSNSAYLGGILGFSSGSRSGLNCSNNLSIGIINSPSAATRSGALVGNNGKTGVSTIFVNNYILQGLPITGSATSSSAKPTAIEVTAAQLTNSTLPTLLNPHNWIQGTSYPIPSFNPFNHVYGSNGFCSYCDDGYQPATLVGNYYEIDNGGKLFWLAQQVNSGTGTAYNAKLTADIDLENRNWTPMGNAANKYTGEFDGQGYSITNLSINNNTDCTAFIGYHNGTKDVRNFSISGNITYTGNHHHNIGRVLAYNIGGNKVEDIQCSVDITATIATGKVRLGGIVSRAESGSTISRCIYSGTIDGKATTMQVAGIVGWCNTGTCTVKDCLFSGKLISTYLSSGNTAYVGGIYGYSYYALTCTNNLCIGTIEVPSGATKYVGALIGGKRSSGGTFSNNHVMLNGVTNLYGTGYNAVDANIISDANIANLTDGTTLAALGTDNWAQDTSNPVPKAFTCTESNGGATATVTGTVCAYNFDIFKNAVKDYATVDISGANMTSNIADSDVESLLTNNGLVYVPSTTEYCGKNIVNDGICDDFELAEGKPFAPTTGFEASAATYTRTISNAWGTICLPFEVESDANVTYYTTGTINEDVLTLTSADVVSAGTPAICKFTTTGENTIESYVVNVCTDVAEDTQSDDITLIGSFAKQTILAADVPNAYYISGGKFWHATGTLTVNPFRAYFTTSGSSSSNKFDIAIGDDDITAVEALTGEGDVTIVAIYTADGKQISDLQNGLNIVKLSNGNTKKIILN